MINKEITPCITLNTFQVMALYLLLAFNYSTNLVKLETLHI